MCFVIDESVCPKMLTAKEDIVCYKKITKDLNSAHQNFKYEFNKLYKIKFWRFKILKDQRDNRDKHSIYRGFHSFQKPLFDIPSYNIYVKCIIPKGAKYYFNNENENVSNSIIIKEIFNNKEKPI